MGRSDVIYLIKYIRHQDEIGQWVVGESSDSAVVGIAVVGKAIVGKSYTLRQEIFCDVRSITRTEWFEAGRNGIEHPAYIFIMNRNEYDGEETVEYNGKLYGIYRTYEGRNQNLELYAEAKGGLHNG